MSDPTQDLEPPQSNAAQQSDAAETPPGSPEEFISMAHEVNPISGEEHSSEVVVSNANLPVAVPSTSQMGPLEQVQAALASVPSTLGQMGADKSSLLVVLGLTLVSLPLLVLLASLLTVIHTIPLLAPLLQMIGVGYGVWFIYRYLLFASGRQELLALWQKLSGAMKVQ